MVEYWKWWSTGSGGALEVVEHWKWWSTVGAEDLEVVEYLCSQKKYEKSK